MQKQFFELDPQGDVLLTLRRPNVLSFVWRSPTSDKPANRPEADNDAPGSGGPENKPWPGEPTPEPTPGMDESGASEESEQVQFLLSSRHLSLASPVFDAMLSGGWKESTDLAERPRKIARLENRDTSNSGPQLCHEISATEWNTDALLLLMNIIHGHHRKLPREVHLDTLAHFSVLVDYYKCHEITEVFAHLWIDRLNPYLTMPSHYMRMIFASWVFSNVAVFEQMTELAIKESEGPLQTMSLPLPPIVISSLEEKRMKLLKMVLHPLDETRKGLVKGTKGCRFHCSSMLLGALMIGMEKHKLIPHQLLESCSGRSIKQIKSILLSLDTPTWYVQLDGAYRPSQHSCSIKSMLEPALDIIWKKSKGLKLDNFRVQQKDEELPKV